MSEKIKLFLLGSIIFILSFGINFLIFEGKEKLKMMKQAQEIEKENEQFWKDRKEKEKIKELAKEQDKQIKQDTLTQEIEGKTTENNINPTIEEPTNKNTQTTDKQEVLNNTDKPQVSDNTDINTVDEITNNNNATTNDPIATETNTQQNSNSPLSPELLEKIKANSNLPEQVLNNLDSNPELLQELISNLPQEDINNPAVTTEVDNNTEETSNNNSITEVNVNDTAEETANNNLIEDNINTEHTNTTDKTIEEESISELDKLFSGQATTTKESKPEWIEYTIQSGDYWQKIASQFNTTTETLQEKNKDTTNLVTGYTILVPNN